MNSFDRTFSLVAALCLAAVLIAVVPAGILYARSLGSFSLDDPGHTILTVAGMVALGTFWCLLAAFARLLFSDWVAARRQRQTAR